MTHYTEITTLVGMETKFIYRYDFRHPEEAREKIITDAHNNKNSLDYLTAALILEGLRENKEGFKLIMETAE